MERLFEMDGQLLLWIREVFAGPVMDKIMSFISSLANKGMLWIGIGMVLLLFGVKERKWSNRGLLVLLSLAFNMVICNLLLKPLVARTRPYDLLGYEILVRRLGDYSFPSGHTSAAPKTSRKPSSLTAIATRIATFSYSPPQLRRK